MKMNWKVIGIIAIVLGIAGIVAFSFSKKFEKEVAQNAISKKAYSIEQKWELPEILEEISGITYFALNRIACVQDEDGTIFIYDLEKEVIEKEIDFGGSGDYEALTVIENDAFVLRSDGVLFEVKNFQHAPKTVEYDPGIDHSINFEGLCLSKDARKLLMITKDEDGNNDVRNIYSFHLGSRTFDKEPFSRLEIEKGIFKNYEGSFRPSEIEINPSTREFYILDGRNPRLLILNSSLKVLEMIPFDEDEFEQPEGITFGNGKLFISNEAGKNAGNILQVQLNPDHDG